MATTRRLRAVAPGEKAPSKPRRKRITSVADAVKNGDQREQLVAMRARIAKAIDEPNIRASDLAALSRRLFELVREIEAIDARESEDAAESTATGDESWVAI
jgi:hypothetical protein